MRLPAVSGQVSAVSGQLGHECRKHLLDLDDMTGEPCVVLYRSVCEVVREEE